MMNNTIEHLSCGGFAVLPLPQVVPVPAGQLTNNATTTNEPIKRGHYEIL
jgi:hypothetical protein